MNGRSIPGFHYDPIKQKYFKIAKISDAPTASQYTKDAVKALNQYNAFEQRQRQRTSQERKQRVQHPKVLQSPLLWGAGFQREVLGAGRGVRARSAASLAYGSGFVEDWGYHVRIDNPYKARLFAWDEASGGFLIGMSTGHESSMLGSQKHIYPSSLTGWSEHQTSILASYPSDVSSISISRSRTALVTTLGGRTNAAANFMALLEPEPDSPNQGPMFDMQVRCEWQDEDSVWSSAVNPFDDSPTMFAVGSTRRLSLFSEINGMFKPHQLFPTTSDVLAVSWLNPSTIVAGLRNGKVYLYDRRSTGHSMRLRQRSAIVGLRCPNDVNVVACGIENSLVMYDLRMQRDDDRPPKKRKGARDGRGTTPVIQYPYNNRWATAVGFDISVEAGLVAAADDKNRVQLYSLWTGEKAKELLAPTDHVNTWSPTKPVQCLEFVDMDGKDALMASTGVGIVRIDW